MMCHSNNNNLTAYRPNRHNGFTLIEMVAAIGVLTVILSFVMVAINNCIMATIDSQSKMEAFQIARENMETLLSKNSIEEDVEFGVSELNPDIEWQTAVESFYEPITSRMWIQAVCSASYTDSSDERQEIELTHWITNLSKADIKKIQEQEELEAEYLAKYGEDETKPEEPEEPTEPKEPDEIIEIPSELWPLLEALLTPEELKRYRRAD